jgi:hypothetical protein
LATCPTQHYKRFPLKVTEGLMGCDDYSPGTGAVP